MSKNQTKKPEPKAEIKSDFVTTFRKYEDMNPGEQAAFKQGCKTVSNDIKEKLGFKKPRAV